MRRCPARALGLLDVSAVPALQLTAKDIAEALS